MTDERGVSQSPATQLDRNGFVHSRSGDLLLLG